MKIFELFFATQLFVFSSVSFAGGVLCKECPGETDKCFPRPDCPIHAGELEIPLQTLVENTLDPLQCQASNDKASITVKDDQG